MEKVSADRESGNVACVGEGDYMFVTIKILKILSVNNRIKHAVV